MCLAQLVALAVDALAGINGVLSTNTDTCVYTLTSHRLIPFSGTNISTMLSHAIVWQQDTDDGSSRWR